jgi:hypothetical protein
MTCGGCGRGVCKLQQRTNAVFSAIAHRLDSHAAYFSRIPKIRTRGTWRILQPTPAASRNQDTSA